jgi:hypothetical protein
MFFDPLTANSSNPVKDSYVNQQLGKIRATFLAPSRFGMLTHGGTKYMKIPVIKRLNGP